MDKYQKANARNWDARVPVRAASRFYNVKAFLTAGSSLLPLLFSLKACRDS
jgi:hypothetical protein